ncbi:ATP-dependent endonuclease [Aquipseudomonas alcaligenes]|uniref:AAA ATPase domain-containing protein n=1 Tax=Aquipseudomonas alcaligenes TaxID=43263 RepID=A0A1N6QNT6_AQUAC|nr:AAA family ATPase [Pseudomonas alcaligenes]SIQ18234.1 AAA ATPase domain-containing protein [Pseudomonas alcaligenes]
MHIKNIQIENFKAFKKINIECNERFNVIVGENNIGKSTIFEALSLWKFAYDSLIQERNKNKFYKASTNYYLSFSSLSQIRLVDDDDIFYAPSIGSAAITLTIVDNEKSFDLKIKFEKPGIKNSYLRIFNSDNFEAFERFSEHIKNKQCTLKNALFIYQTRPISTIFKDEPFYNNAQIERKISIGKSHDVLRNKILKTENPQATKVSERFASLEGRLERVLKRRYTIRFKNKNRTDEEYVRITIENDKQRELEASLMGSGFLQVVEIFSTIEYIEKNTDGICLILIDEPDSHIHSDLQSHLIDELKSHNDSQAFVITHNDRLINKVNPGELYFLNNAIKENGKLTALQIDEFPKVKEALASILSEIEQDNQTPILITEGASDQNILCTAWAKLFPENEMPFKIIPSGIQIDESKRTGNADSVRRSIEYISTLSDQTIIGLFDNDREGNEQFKGLNSNIFEPHSAVNFCRKHLTKNIYGMLLPITPHRKIFSSPQNIIQRYFVIEHYFSDEILDANEMKDEPILGTEVFEIKGNKSKFATACANLDASEFENFRLLFDEITKIINQ